MYFVFCSFLQFVDTSKNYRSVRNENVRINLLLSCDIKKKYIFFYTVNINYSVNQFFFWLLFLANFSDFI